MPCDLPTVATIHDLSILLHPEWHPPDRVVLYESTFLPRVRDFTHILTVSDAARDEILQSGGSLSHHHGVGKLRRAFLPRIMSETALQWKRELKKSLDPTNIFGAGNQGLDMR